MHSLPHDGTLDSTLSFFADGYEFISKRCHRHRSDLFETRLLLRRAVCTMGEEATRIFYTPGRFTRQGALPPTALVLLQDRGSALLQDDDTHQHRKRMFMAFMTPARIQQLSNLMTETWLAQLPMWERRSNNHEEIVLFDEVRAILCRSVCAWAGIPLSVSESMQRTREFGAMVDGAGSIGFRAIRGELLRTRTERWARAIIKHVRAGTFDAPEDSVVSLIANYRGLTGQLLSADVAAIELLNVLRPTTAIDRYITFAALALHQHPECRKALEEDDDETYLTYFVQEVRRFYPFFPIVGGRVRREFTWQGHQFPKGTWVMLDIYGTNHDPRVWNNPGTFDPERFRDEKINAFNFIPQGGGDYDDGHRCAGEWLTIALMKQAVRILVNHMRYTVPSQDLTVPLARIPAIPKSHFRIANVHPVPPPTAVFVGSTFSRVRPKHRSSPQASHETTQLRLF